MTELGLIARLYKIRECQRNDFPKGCAAQPLLENALSALIRPQSSPQLFRAKRQCRLYGCGATCWNQRGKSSYQEQSNDHSYVGDRIDG
jgi:hypothetical protein